MRANCGIRVYAIRVLIAIRYVEKKVLGVFGFLKRFNSAKNKCFGGKKAAKIYGGGR